MARRDQIINGEGEGEKSKPFPAGKLAGLVNKNVIKVIKTTIV
jgi:hypothetical protein